MAKAKGSRTRGSIGRIARARGGLRFLLLGALALFGLVALLLPSAAQAANSNAYPPRTPPPPGLRQAPIFYVNPIYGYTEADPQVPWPQQPANMGNDCFWADNLNIHNPQTNRTGADTNNGYWLSSANVQPGDKLIFKGQFPHNRFMSLQAYKSENGVPGFAAGGFDDEQTDPDPGSFNPFRPGVPRNVTRRNFTLTVVTDPEPSDPSQKQPNTLYAGNEATKNNLQQMVLAWRSYRPDLGTSLNGDELLPALSVQTRSGITYTGQTACSYLFSTNQGQPPSASNPEGTPAASGPGFLNFVNSPLNTGAIPDGLYVFLRNLGAKGHPAQSPVQWYLFSNPQLTFAPLLQGTFLSFLIPFLSTDPNPGSGTYPNPYNKYIYTYVNPLLGPDRTGHNVVVFRGKMPTHWDTYFGEIQNGAAVNPNNEPQVRYVGTGTLGALSQYANVATGTPYRFDQNIPVDKDGFYTIVYSRAEDRPKTAIDGCGVAWEELSPFGDYMQAPVRDNNLSIIVMRHMLTNPTFQQGMTNIPPDQALTPQFTMGPYYPAGSYTTPQAFDLQHLNCISG